MADITFHYPPELLQLLTDAIPLLCRSKEDVLVFLEGAGVSTADLRPWRQRLASAPKSVGKHAITRDILTILNQRAEAGLQQRREVLRRVVEFDTFTGCWPDDRLKAQGLVAEIRTLVKGRDTITRLAQEAEQEMQRRREAKRLELEAVAVKKQAREAVRADLAALFGMTDKHARGIALEGILNRLFKEDGLLIREAFVRRDPDSEGAVEQIDGVVQLDGHLYLVEMKWRGEHLGPGHVSQHMVRVTNRGHSRGIMISASGYTPAAIQVVNESLHHAPFILTEIREFVTLLDGEDTVAGMLRTKVTAAVVDKVCFRPYP